MGSTTDAESDDTDTNIKSNAVNSHFRWWILWIPSKVHTLYSWFLYYPILIKGVTGRIPMPYNPSVDDADWERLVTSPLFQLETKERKAITTSSSSSVRTCSQDFYPVRAAAAPCGGDADVFSLCQQTHSTEWMIPLSRIPIHIRFPYPPHPSIVYSYILIPL